MAYDIFHGHINAQDLRMYFAGCCFNASGIDPNLTVGYIQDVIYQTSTWNDEYDDYVYEELDDPLVVAMALKSDGNLTDIQFEASKLINNLELLDIPELGYVRAGNDTTYVTPNSQSAASRGFCPRKYSARNVWGDTTHSNNQQYLNLYKEMISPKRYTELTSGIKRMVGGRLNSFAVNRNVAVIKNYDSNFATIFYNNSKVGSIDAEGNMVCNLMKKYPMLFSTGGGE